MIHHDNESLLDMYTVLEAGISEKEKICIVKMFIQNDRRGVGKHVRVVMSRNSGVRMQK